MKIIYSGTGGGKTTEMASMMGDLAKRGVNSCYISDEGNQGYLRELLIGLNYLQYGRHIYYENNSGDLGEVVDTILHYKLKFNLKHFFLDVNFTNGDVKLEGILRLLQSLEEAHGLNVHVALQTNAEHGESLVVEEFCKTLTPTEQMWSVVGEFQRGQASIVEFADALGNFWNLANELDKEKLSSILAGSSNSELLKTLINKIQK